MEWRLKTFQELTLDELYDILRLRAEIFVVEQDCPYQDLDGLDRCSRHLFAVEDGETVACLRLLPPGARYEEPSIGRFVVKESLRRRGLGRQGLAEAIRLTKESWPGRGIRISGQAYLRRFYESMGFAVTRGPYDEDGIPHFEMLLP